MRLKSDVTSHFKPSTVYGRKGDEVRIISESTDGVCIVEKVDGERFSVKVELLSADKIKKETAQVAAVTNKPINHRVPATRKKAAPINQQPNLF